MEYFPTKFEGVKYVVRYERNDQSDLEVVSRSLEYTSPKN